MEEYPKQISYDGPRNLCGFYPEFHDLVEKLKIGLKFTMLAEQKNEIFNDGVAHGRNLLFQLNRGEITSEDFNKRIEKY